MQLLRLCLVSVFTIVASDSSASGEVIFHGLGALVSSPTLSSADGVSASGQVVVGYSEGTTTVKEAFRWTSDGGMISLGHLDGAGAGFAEAT
jgi:probable HAF family extracellular repeat protein